MARSIASEETERAVRETFPLLASRDSFRIASEQDESYNCIAYAAEDTTRIWWPVDPDDSSGRFYWPPIVPRQATVVAFIAAFAVLGYEICTGGAFEDGYQKIALYVRDGKPQHAARQCLRSKVWVSKLGGDVDIEHERADSLTGDLYGEVYCVMKRELDPDC